MIELATLARPYAEAVFKRAKETKASGEWSDMLSLLAVVMQEESLSLAVDNPNVEREEFVRLLLDICEGQINEEGENFVRLLIANNRLDLIQHISRIYEDLRAEDEGYVDVKVKTAYSLSKKDQSNLSKSLEKHLDRDVRLQIEEDNSLIGGVWIRAGDTVIDGSVLGQLQQLSKRLGA